MNPLVSDFLTMCRMLDLHAADLAFERICAMDYANEAHNADAVAYLDDQFVEVVAHAAAASWKVDPNNPFSGAPHLAPMILPFWKRLVDECPHLNNFWVVYQPAGVTSNGFPVLKVA